MTGKKPYRKRERPATCSSTAVTVQPATAAQEGCQALEIVKYRRQTSPENTLAFRGGAKSSIKANDSPTSTGSAEEEQQRLDQLKEDLAARNSPVFTIPHRDITDCRFPVIYLLLLSN